MYEITFCTCKVVICQYKHIFHPSPCCGEQGVAQWCEHSPPTKVAQVQILVSTQYVGWVCCWFSPLLLQVFPGYSGFPKASKTNISKFQLDQESGRWRTTLWICITCYLQIIIYLFYLFILFVAIVVGFVVIQRQCYHGNVMSHFSSLLTIN